jgi:hypothetical protein
MAAAARDSPLCRLGRGGGITRAGQAAAEPLSRAGQTVAEPLLCAGQTVAEPLPCAGQDAAEGARAPTRPRRRAPARRRGEPVDGSEMWNRKGKKRTGMCVIGAGG